MSHLSLFLEKFLAVVAKCGPGGDTASPPFAARTPRSRHVVGPGTFPTNALVDESFCSGNSLVKQCSVITPLRGTIHIGCFSECVELVGESHAHTLPSIVNSTLAEIWWRIGDVRFCPFSGN